MRLVRYSTGGTAPQLGLTDEKAIAPLSSALGATDDMIDLIEKWDGVSSALAAIADFPIPLGEVDLHAPIGRPRKILGIGLNYQEHAVEGGRDAPAEQMWFMKPPTTVSGPFDPIRRPRVSVMLDYEAELVVVIGKGGRYLSEDEAMHAVFGYCVGNDVSARDWQLKTSQVTLGKAFDGHAPFGPWITTKASIDASDLALKCLVNGQQRQSARTSQMIFSIAAQVSLLSQVMTLEVGDLLFTGTPAGVGGRMNPQSWLVSGDVVRVEIEGLGAIENPVIEDDAPSRA